MKKELLPQLSKMKSQDKDALIYKLWEENQKLKEELEKLKQKTKNKTSKNSSLPPSTDQKANNKNKSIKKKKKKHKLEGAIANILKKTKKELIPTMSEIVEKLRNSQQVYSDETSARVRGKNEWEWVFQNSEVCYHIIEPSRGAKVIKQVMDTHEPSVWGSDLFSAQKNHPASSWQVCLAHQIRDTQYGIEQGDEIFSGVMEKLFLKAIDLHRRRDNLSNYDYHQSCDEIKKELFQALDLKPTSDDGKRLLKRYQKIKDNLFLFLENPLLEPTNNSSEQALRWSVIFRKITNGFRSDWGKDLFSYVRSIINTGKRQGLSAIESIRVALSPSLSLFSPS